MSSDLFPRILWASAGSRSESDCACPDTGTASTVLYSLPGEQPESDCACPAAHPAPSAGQHFPPALWQLSPHLYRAPLPQAHELTFNPTGPVSVAVLNEPARSTLDAFSTPHPLTDPTARQLAVLGLLTPAQLTTRHSQLATHHSPLITAWLHVTDACNLRCSYCYVTKSGRAMSEETGRAAVDAVFRSALAHGFCGVKLKYGGGEPTLNFSLVRSLHRHAETLAARHNLELRAVLLSNGTLLTGEMIDWLRDESVRLMISLDGIGPAHDAQRPFADGRGSFVQVARNVDRALARGLPPYLSITVTPHNAGNLAETVAFALERDLPFNLNFIREPGVGQVGNLFYADDRIIGGVQAAFAVIEAALPRRRLIDALVDRSGFGSPHEYPCGAGRNYLVIDPQGRVARCQMEMSRPVTDVWADDPLQAVRERRDGFQNIPVDEKEDCRDCVWRYWCAGGCPLLTYRAGGRSDRPSPYCAVYKALYPDLLRLEGLRLLKW
ncbi:MAG: radical SAM/SPASM domain-containing protein, partial [Chloroflexi bacterium]